MWPRGAAGIMDSAPTAPIPGRNRPFVLDVVSIYLVIDRVVNPSRSRPSPIPRLFLRLAHFIILSFRFIVIQEGMSVNRRPCRRLVIVFF
jgi:hypothetical protein